ncbi:MAG: protein adenylyltransferase SelO [Shimia sp.]
MKVDNSYARLPERMFAKVAPTSVKAPQLRAWNEALGAELGLMPDAAVYAGNSVPDWAEPIATLYAGHQFGNWNPQLGDGRAILLGEVLVGDQRYDVQLKGAGQTPFSRMGDGRAWVGPALREYVVSEAMHALGIPTTRALALTTTGETVLREAPLPGAVMTRVASSHIRVGTFQVYAAREDTDALRALANHTMARHYPGVEALEEFLLKVVEGQARLVAQWQAVGFIHGVMNTDNCHVGGLTIDYGPCAFMDGYHPGRVFSSIDQQGRYAYGNQPNIAAWNLAQFATALLPLMPNREMAIRCFTGIVNSFADSYKAEWRARFGAKLGLAETTDEDVDLITDLLSMMAEVEADFTTTFTALSDGSAPEVLRPLDGWKGWEARWQKRSPDRAAMKAANPAVIPRNHLIEQAIQAAVQDDYAPFEALNTVLATPFETPGDTRFLTPPTSEEQVTRTFCGT